MHMVHATHPTLPSHMISPGFSPIHANLFAPAAGGRRALGSSSTPRRASSITIRAILVASCETLLVSRGTTGREGVYTHVYSTMSSPFERSQPQRPQLSLYSLIKPWRFSSFLIPCSHPGTRRCTLLFRYQARLATQSSCDTFFTVVPFFTADVVDRFLDIDIRQEQVRGVTVAMGG